MGDMELELIIKWLVRFMYWDKFFIFKVVRRWKKLEIMIFGEFLKMNGDVVRDIRGQYIDRFVSFFLLCGLSVNEFFLEGFGFCKSSIYFFVYYRR